MDGRGWHPRFTDAGDQKNPKTSEVLRAIFNALSHPGQLYCISNSVNAPAPLNTASAAICLTWSEYETPVWTDLNSQSNATSWLQYECGCSIVPDPWLAKVALVTQPAVMPPLGQFLGSPDRTTNRYVTIICQVDDFIDIKNKTATYSEENFSAKVYPVGLSPAFWRQWRRQAPEESRRMDILITCEDVFTVMPQLDAHLSPSD